MKRCTDKYGNFDNDLKVGAVVESDIAIFTVGKIHTNGLVSMDKDAMYILKNVNHPMANCVREGNYAVLAACLNFSSLN